MTDRSHKPPASQANRGRPTDNRGRPTDEPARPTAAPGAGSRRAGRRETSRPTTHRTTLPLERRGLLLGGAALVAFVLIGAYLFFGATQKTYACGALLTPAPSATPAPGGSPAPLGQIQEDMGRRHTDPGASARYASCPPASGAHYADPGGPIPNRFYGKDETALPQGWIHNLEHGGFVVLYRCPDGACDDATQQQLRQFVAEFPPSPVCNLPPGTTAPVVARFDEMSTPFAALVWGRVLLLDTLDTATILDFYRTQGERTNPEPQCAPPSPSPAASPAPATSPEPATSPSPSPSPS